MKDSHTQEILEKWLETQHTIIEKTIAILNTTIHMCQEDNHKDYEGTLEVFVSNIRIHIDQIFQYDACINTLISQAPELPANLEVLHTINTQKIDQISAQTKICQALLQKEYHTLKDSIFYTQSFTAQLTHI